MRNGQKRMRGRGGGGGGGGGGNHRKSQNPLTRVYESNGPDVKIRGTASHIAEKYIQLARDSQSSGDPVAAENYYQHAEHYYRLIATAQEQFRQQNPYYNQPQGTPQGAADDNFDDDGEDQPFMGQNEPSFVPREPQPQPYLPREGQPFPNQQMQARPQPQPGYPQAQPQPEHEPNGLPAFITGGGAPQPQQANGGNGHDQGERNERYGGHHRRRRRRGGYRPDRPEAGSQAGGDAGDAPGQAE